MSFQLVVMLQYIQHSINQQGNYSFETLKEVQGLDTI